MKHTGKVTLLTAALLALSAHAVAAETTQTETTVQPTTAEVTTQQFNQQQKRQRVQKLLFRKIQKTTSIFMCISQVKNQNTLVFTKLMAKRTTKWTVSQSQIRGNGTEDAGITLALTERC